MIDLKGEWQDSVSTPVVKPPWKSWV